MSTYTLISLSNSFDKLNFRIRITSDIIECTNQGCSNDHEELELSIQVDDRLWKIEKTVFYCRKNPMIYDWYPKKSIVR